MSITLSICIPIYNCVDYIGQALDSILPQTRDGIEVIVYDGGSTDKTDFLMDKYIKKWSNLYYHRGSIRGGIDADLVKCVELANGKFCWLFSGDDVMCQGAIERALEWIKSGSDIFICKHTICNKDMVKIREHPVLQPDQEFAVSLEKLCERHEWFGRAITTEAFFSFLSGLIVRREKWQNGQLPQVFSNSCWGHVARFFGLISSGLTVCYVAEIWLDQRGGNDSFLDKGIVNRFRIGIEGYHKLADNYFGHESIEAFHIRRVIRNEFSVLALLKVKLQCVKHPSRENRILLDELVKMVYCDNLLATNVMRMMYFSIPLWSLPMLIFVYESIRRVYRVLSNV